jgi:membrane-associated phospholipid phosphatase
MSRRSRVLLAALLCAVLVGTCIAFIDRPVEAYVHAHQRYRVVYQAMAAPSLLPLPFAMIFLVVYAMAPSKTWSTRPLSRNLLALSLAILGATTAKDELKWMFGRPWPDSWVKYGVYAFHPFTDSILYGGFPSGHTSYIAAPMWLLCWLAPRYRVLWIGIIATVMIGLVGASYHFVGDVIAGCFIGYAAASVTVMLMPSLQKPSLSSHIR